MEYKRPVKGEKYRHFKGEEYEILAIAKHSETLEEMVVYQALYGGNEIYVRPLSMFMEFVDDTVRRFELVVDEKDSKALLVDFLDIKLANDKILFLQANKDDLDDSFLSLAAQCLDFVETKEDFEERFYDLIHYLRTIEKFECNRY